MTVNIVRNYLNEAAFEIESVDALINSRNNADLGEMYIQSYYGGWQATVDGPKGGHYVHTTGGTASAPTVGTPVSVGTIGTGVQVGYYWDLDGIEWAINLHNQTINAFMFGTTGVEADTGYSQNLADFFIFTLARPGYYEIPPGVYMVNQTMGGTKTATDWVYYQCAGAQIKRISTTSAYNMVTIAGENIHIYGLSLYGYVDSGTDHTNVVPLNSYGFRLDSGTDQRHIIFENCSADNIPYDGWLIARNCQDIQLINCQGGQTEECFRNTVAVAPSGIGAFADQIKIIGGRYAKARVRPAIDLEPDTSGMIGYCYVGGGVRCTGTLVAEPSNIQHIHIDGVIMDGADALVQFEGFTKLTLGDMHFMNGADIRDSWGPADQGSGLNPLAERVESQIELIGTIYGLDDNAIPEQLLEYSYNTPRFDTTPSSSGPGTATATYNTQVGPAKGVEIACDLRSYLLSRDYPVLPNTIYTFGAYSQLISGANNSLHVAIWERDGGGAILHSWVFEPNLDARHHSLIFRTDPSTVEVRIQIGQNSTSFTGTARFGGLHLYQGIMPNRGWTPHIKERFGPMYTVAPTNGTWEVGETVSIVTPAAGSVGQVCTVAGTPGTWAAF